MSQPNLAQRDQTVHRRDDSKPVATPIDRHLVDEYRIIVIPELIGLVRYERDVT